MSRLGVQGLDFLMRTCQSAFLRRSAAGVCARFAGPCALLLAAFAALVIAGCGAPGKDQVPQTITIVSVTSVSSAHPLQQGTKAQLAVSTLYGEVSTTDTSVVFTLNGSKAGSAQVTSQQSSSSGVVLQFTVPQLPATTPTSYDITVTGETTRGGSIKTAKPFAAMVYPGATITSITPATVHAGQQATISIAGANTNFDQGTTTASFGAGISVG